MNKVPGVYVISDMNNGKSYVGSSVNVNSRINTHKQKLKNNIHGNTHLQNSYNKNHLFRYITLPVEKPEDTLKIEQQLLDEFFDTGTLFNIAKDALAPMLGLKHSQEAINKIIKAHLNVPLTEEHKLKLSEIAKCQGRKPSEDALAKSVIANKCRIRTQEELQKISDSSRERMKDPLAREHLRNINLGIKHTPENILKMKEIGKNNIFSEKAKEARLAATIGRVQTQEEIAKRIASNVGRKREGVALENIKNAGLNKSKPVCIDGISYRSTKIAAEVLNVTPVVVTKRINKTTDKYKEWKYEK